MFRVKRIYDEYEESDGIRVLVDRLWPRGMTRERARLDRWMKEIAPSTELRVWSRHRESRWEMFCLRYEAELDQRPEPVKRLRDLGDGRIVTLLYGSRNQTQNHAHALKQYLEEGRIEPS